MKATITIIGQLSSSFAIEKRMNRYEGKPDSKQPNTIILNYKTKSAAYQDIRAAYKGLKRDDPTDWNLKHSKNFVSYDAATAKINEQL